MNTNTNTNTNTNIEEVKRIARILEQVGTLNRWNDNSTWKLYYNDVFMLLNKVARLDCFGAKVATSVLEAVERYEAATNRMAMPKMSGKQAWCIACAAVENNVKVEL